MTDLQRYNPGGNVDPDMLRRSPTARAYAQGLRDKADLQAAQAREQQAKHDAELAQAAADERARDEVIDLSTPEQRASYAASTNQHLD